MSLWDRAAELLAAREPCALITLAVVKGSAPREAGAAMLVWQDGQAATIGGGNLEFLAIAQARRLLAAGDAFAVQDYPLGPLLAQCCGGKVRVVLERLDARFIADARAVQGKGRPYLIETAVEGRAIRKSVLEDSDPPDRDTTALFDRMGRPVGFESADFVMVQSIDPQKPCLALYGAGHVGLAVARIAASLPFAARWFDTRAEYRGTSVNGISAKIAPDLETALAGLPPASFHLVFTHSHALDYALVRAILKRGDFRFCGVIGSATKRARFASRLAADGIAPEAVGRLVCPIGAIGLKSKAPEAVAVAVAAELLLELEGKTAARAAKELHEH
jgi:xanthine dehydrogenase accessory factor